MNIQLATSAIKKEIWEFGNILKWVPIAIAALVIIFPLVGFMLSDVSISHIMEQLKLASQQTTLSGTENPLLPEVLFVSLYSLFAPFLAVAVIIQLYYFTVCLFDERRDASIMFWRSLPVSDGFTIIAKLVMGSLVVPGIFLLAATVTLIFVLLCFFVACIILSIGFDISLWFLWGASNMLSGVSLIWLNMVPFALWMLPIFTWLMLASMFAKKAPFLWATLPLIVLFFIEGVISYHFDFSTRYLAQMIGEYFAITPELAEKVGVNDGFSRLVPLKLLVAKLDIASIVLPAILLYLTYWLRVNKAQA